MPVACQSRAGTEPAGETQSLLLRQKKTLHRQMWRFFYSDITFDILIRAGKKGIFCGIEAEKYLRLF